MAITFRPRRGAILMCNFGMAYVEPEMRKVRQVVVISSIAVNHRHGTGPGLCTVVPFSASAPGTPEPWDVFIPAGRYWSLNQNSWAKCAMVQTISHARLDLVLRLGQRRASEFMTRADIERIETALGLVLELP